MLSTRKTLALGFGARQGNRMLRIVVSVSVLLGLGILLVQGTSSQKHLSVYSTAANYSLPLVQRQARDYVGLLELLEPLGAVTAKTDALYWHLRYDKVQGDFGVGRTHAHVRGHDVDLSGKFLIENGRGLVPVDALNALLPLFLGGPVTFNAESDRLFVGSIATHFTASVAYPSHLVFHFTAPVNPTVATESGKLRMTFTREPITAPASPTLTFDSKAIPSATYSESNGAAEVTVNTTIPLIANFSADGKTITLGPAKTQAEVAATPQQPATNQPANPAPAASIGKPAATFTPATPSSAPRRYFVVIDASHGGDDRGEALSASLPEKDVTVAFARRLRQELDARGIGSLVLRDSDANLSLDERAFFANSTHAALYVVFHAASSGHGVRLYTSLLPYADTPDRGPFRAWSDAQVSFLTLSQAAAGSVAAELRKQNVSVRSLAAPLRPLNNIVTAAIAVEVAPQANDLSQLTAQDYQQLVASGVANGVAAIRSQLGAAP